MGQGTGSAGADAAGPSPAPEPLEPEEAAEEDVEELFYTRKCGCLGISIKIG